ncbi:MAG: putative DsbA family dithiol-disulfide isomerase [Paraglaciecola psychrophila]|jgi:predicted DsbA family dithiol-disulfide isomerase
MTVLKIDIVSDVSCPWCVIGYKALEQALTRVASSVSADITWRAFELNPDMPAAGQDVGEHIQEKYGASPEQSAGNRERISQMGADLGFEFSYAADNRIYNTFDAHRLLHWAKQHGKQNALKLALFDLYFTQRGNPSNAQQLLSSAESVGLDCVEAAEILASNRYTQDVRAEQQQNQQQGISSVPAFIINDKYMISGGQPVEYFEQALLKISQEVG